MVKDSNIESAPVQGGKRKYSSSKMSYLDVTLNGPILDGSVHGNVFPPSSPDNVIMSSNQDVETIDMSGTGFNISWE